MREPEPGGKTSDDNQLTKLHNDSLPQQHYRTSPNLGIMSGGKRQHPHQGEEILITTQNSVFKDTGSPTGEEQEPHIPKLKIKISPHTHKDLLTKLTDNIHTHQKSKRSLEHPAVILEGNISPQRDQDRDNMSVTQARPMGAEPRARDRTLDAGSQSPKQANETSGVGYQRFQTTPKGDNRRGQNQPPMAEEEKSYLEDHKASQHNASLIDGVRNPFSPKESTTGKQHQKYQNVEENQTMTINAFPNRGQPRFSSGSENDEDHGNVSHQTPKNISIEQEAILAVSRPELKISSNRRISNNMRASPSGLKSLPRMPIDEDNFQWKPHGNILHEISPLPNTVAQNIISEPLLDLKSITIKRDLMNSLSPDYALSNLQKIIMRRRSKETDRITNQQLQQLSQGKSPQHRPSFNFNEELEKDQQRQFIETDRGIGQELKRGITPTDIANQQQHTSQERAGNFTHLDQSQKYDIKIDGSGSENEDGHEKGMPMFYESRDYGAKGVTIDKLSHKGNNLHQEENIPEHPPFNLDDDSLDKDKFGEYVRQNAGLKVHASISTYKHEDFQKELDQDLLGESMDIASSENMDQIDPNPFNDVLLTEQKKKIGHHFEKMKTSNAKTESKKGGHVTLTDFSLGTDVKTTEDKEENDDLITKFPRRISTIQSISPQVQNPPKLGKAEEQVTPSPGFHRSKVTVHGSRMKISDQQRQSMVRQSLKRDSVINENLKKLTMPVIEFGVEESDLTDRFKVDIYAKPMLDDERARKMIIGELQAKRLQEEMKKDSSFFLVVQKTPLELVEDIKGEYSWLLRPLYKFRIHVSNIAMSIISSKIFETISVIVILLNSLSLAVEDPTSNTQTKFQEDLDMVFLALYTTEMVLKILGMGFVFNENSYLRDSWNLIDFVVVIVGYIQLFIQGTDINLGGLRTFRVLRPLRSIQRIEGLKRIVQALLSSLPLLGDTIIILLFFFFIFAIAGLQLFGGNLKRHCINEDTGVVLDDEEHYYCGYVQCPPGYFCGKTLENPNFNQMNFDTIFYALIAIFTSVTLEGWTSIMTATQKTLSPLTFVFHIPLVFIGAFFLLNLTLAVIKSKFSEEHQKKNEAEAQEAADMEEMDQDQLEKLGQKKNKMLMRKGKHIEEVEFEMLETEEQQKLIALQSPIQKIVMKKWKTIMFIKDRMREHIKRYKLKKERKAQLLVLEQERALRSISKQETQENLQTEVQNGFQDDNNNYGDEIEIIDKTGERAGSYTSPKRQSKKIYKEDIPRVIIRDISPNQESGSEQTTPIKSIKNGAGLDLKSNDLRRKLQSNEAQAKRRGNRSGVSYSPLIKEQMGIKSKKAQQANSMIVIRRPVRIQDMDKQFFLGFIDQDLDTISQMYSENDLIKMARQFKSDYEPQIKIGKRKELITVTGIIQVGGGGHSTKPSPKLTMEDRGSSLEAVQQSKERFLNEFSLPKINEDTGEHDHTGKKKSDEQSSDRNILIDEGKKSQLSPKSPGETQKQIEIEYTPKGVDSDEQSPLRIRDSPENTQREGLFSAQGTSRLQSRLGGERAGIRKNFVINTDEGVSFKIKPSRVRANPQQDSENKQSLLQQNQEQDDLGTSHHTPVPQDTAKHPYKGYNKVIPFNIEPSPLKQEQPLKGTELVINIEKSVLNSRFIVEQEIDPTQKLHIRKDKIEFASAKDVLEDRSNKDKILKARALKKVMIAIPMGFKGYMKSISIKPYQRRQMFTAKTFMPDEDQVQCLNILEMESHELEATIQKQYDHSYQSELYITSTLSVCIKKVSKEMQNYSITETLEKQGFRGLRTRRIQDARVQDLHFEHFAPSLHHKEKNYHEEIQLFNLEGLNREQVNSERQPLQSNRLPSSRRNILSSRQQQQQIINQRNVSRSEVVGASGRKASPIKGAQNILPKTTIIRKQVNVAQLRQPKDPKAIVHEVQKHLFFKNQSVPQMSRSYKTKTHNHFEIDELIELHIKNQQLSEFGHKGSSNADDKEEQEKEMKRRKAMLSKQAARDSDLQRKIIVTYLNKGALLSRLYRHIYTRRKNMVSPEEMKHAHIAELYNNRLSEEIQKMMEEDEADAANSSEAEDEEDSDEENPIKDDFLDMPVDFVHHINKARLEAASRKKNEHTWSGQDVLLDYDPSYAHGACETLGEIRVWPRKVHGIAKICQVYIKKFVRTKLFDSLLTLFVFLNTLCLGLDRYGMGEWENRMLTLANQIFTWIFIAEMMLKVIGLGPIKYLRDKINHLDGLVVVISIAELVVTTQFAGAHQSFRMVRIFRIFRIIRVGKLLRTFQSMQIIVDVLVKSMNSFIYLALLLLLFIFIFTLLGMQIFGGNLYFEENYDGPPGVPRNNFNSFNSAFLTTFQVLTMEGWHQLFYDALRSDVARPISAVYYISWVFLGNFMLLNLFLAILLDSFTNEELHKPITDDQIDPKKIQEKHIRQLKKKEGAELIEYYSLMHEGDSKKAKKGPAGLGGKKKKNNNNKQRNQNLLDESFEYDEKALTTKKMDILGKNKVMFDGVQCERAFYLLSYENKFRIIIYNLCMSDQFEWVIMALVILSSLKLVIDTYLTGEESQSMLAVVSENFDRFFTGAFALESLIRATALGFCIDQGSYLRETWSQIDFFIVIISIIDTSFEQINLPVIKILRLFRTLRPLRFISHNSGMKTIVSALVQSVGGIFNVLIVVFTVWMMFAILAVNLFGGKLNYCSKSPYRYETKEECLKHRGEWLIQQFNYDSVPNAMLSLFTIATMENWPNYMYQAMNIQGEDLGPKPFASPENGYFFVVFILIGSFLFLNLFVGVIFKEFEDAQQEEKATLMLKENQIKWVDMMKMIVEANPDLETTNKPKQRWRQMIHEFITGQNFKHNYFDFFVMFCIIMNMFLLAVIYDDSSQAYNNTLDSINYFFTLVFALECVLKLLAFGPSYFNNSWNIFDFFVVCSSGIDIVMDQLNSVNLKFLRVGPQLARILRVLRVSRLFRLLNKYKGLQALIQTIQFSLPALFNVFALLMLIYFIFSILATFLFKSISEGDIINENNNFQNFGMSMLLLIRISTGEDWNYIMKDTMRTEDDHCIPNKTCGSSWAPLFFFPYMMLCTFIMLNLFILVIIQQFETYYLDADNVIARFKEDTERFKQVWTHFTSDHNCIKIKDTRLVAFMGQMDPPLGMKGEPMSDIIKSVMRMELSSDNEGFVYFNELLYRMMRRVYGDTHVKNKILIESEINTMEKINEIKQKMIKKSRVQERLQAAQVNPFSLQLFMNASFRGWLKITKQNLTRRQDEQILGFNAVQMPTFAEGTFEDQSHDQEDEHEEEIFYETVEDIELVDTDSFVSEELMEDENMSGDGNMNLPPRKKIIIDDEEDNDSFHNISLPDINDKSRAFKPDLSDVAGTFYENTKDDQEVSGQNNNNSGENGQLKSSSSSEAFRQHLDDVRLTQRGNYLIHPEELEKKQSAALFNMLHLDLQPTINFSNIQKSHQDYVEEQDKESSGEENTVDRRQRQLGQGTVRSYLDSQAREIVQHRKRMVEKHFKGSSSSSNNDEDSEAGEEDHTAKVQPNSRASPNNRIKKAFGSALDANQITSPQETQYQQPEKYSKGINKQNPKFLKFKDEYYQNKIEIDSDFDDDQEF